MAKTSGEIELEFIQTAKEKTGKTLEQWLKVIKPTGFKKQIEILNWLKKEHKLNHMQAQLLAGIFLNNGKPVYQNEGNLLENQFAKFKNMKPLFEFVSSKILKQFPNSQIIPKKTYVSFTSVREFAAINIKKEELRLGMDLGDVPFKGVVEKAKLTGPMTRISHMVVIKSKTDLDDTVMKLLAKSNERVNP